MSKTYTVQSKHKNPDKYIGKLKSQLEGARASSRYWLEQYDRQCGELIVLWTPHAGTQKIINGFNLGQLKPKQKIAIIGIVKKVAMSTCSTGNEESSIEYEIKETRRLPND